jgi:hypothetical protein
LRERICTGDGIPEGATLLGVVRKFVSESDEEFRMEIDSDDDLSVPRLVRRRALKRKERVQDVEEPKLPLTVEIPSYAFGTDTSGDETDVGFF